MTKVEAYIFLWLWEAYISALSEGKLTKLPGLNHTYGFARWIVED